MTHYLVGRKYIVFFSLFSVKKFLKSVQNHTMETEKKESNKNIQTHLFHQQTFLTFHISSTNSYLAKQIEKKRLKQTDMCRSKH